MPEFIGIRSAMTSFVELVARVEAGEEVIITRHGKAVARLIPAPSTSRKRRFGALRGKISVGPEFFEPLPNEEIR